MSEAESATLTNKRRRFWRIAGAGAAFQGGAAAVDSATVVASLVFQLTGSAFAVGFASAVLRLGWLLPQLVVGYLAERVDQRMPFYVFGAYGRAACLALIALLLWWGWDWPQLDWPPIPLAAGFLALWTVYAFVSGVVALPYNDIVGRSIPGDRWLSSTSRIISSFSDAAYLIRGPPHPRVCFFEKTQLKRLFRNHLLEILCLAAQLFHLVSVRRARRITRQTLLSGLHEVL